MARAAREELGLTIADRLDGVSYAQHVGVAILPFNELALSEEAKHQLLVGDPESWSGMTIRFGKAKAIIVNPAHPPERQCNTVMHELSHIILDHVPTRVDIGPEGVLIVGEYAEDAEGEADWLAGTFLLPRDALISLRSQGMNNSQIAKRFGVSLALCDWRTRMTGIDVQMRRAAVR